MRIFGKKYRLVRALAFALALLCAAPVTAQAAGEEEGAEIILYYHGVTPEEERIALAGAEFTLYRVGSTEGGWLLEGSFAASGVSLADGSASGQRESAGKLYAYALEKGIPGNTAATDARGRAEFTGLRDGLYLIAPKKELESEGGAFRSAPFLLAVPAEGEDGTLSYEVLAEPKNEWVPDGEEPGQDPGGDPDKDPDGDKDPDKDQDPDKDKEKDSGKGSSGKPGSVQTGDTAPVEALLALAVACVCVIVFLVCRMRKKREAGEEK